MMMMNLEPTWPPCMCSHGLHLQTNGRASGKAADSLERKISLRMRGSAQDRHPEFHLPNPLTLAFSKLGPLFSSRRSSHCLLARLQGIEVELALRGVPTLHTLRKLILLSRAWSSSGCRGRTFMAVDDLCLPWAHDCIHSTVGNTHSHAGSHA